MFDDCKQVFHETRKNCLEKYGDDSNDEVDEKFISLFKQLNSEMQTDSDMTVEHSNFDHEVCTSFPVITSDKVNLRWMPIKASLEEYVSVGKVRRDNNSDGDNNNGKDNEN